MLIMGVDPGRYGGIVVIDLKAQIQYLEVMPREFSDMVDVFRIISRFGEAVLGFVEKAQVFPSQGGVGNFTYGEHFGTLKSAIKSVGVPFELVPPQTWTRTMHEGCSREKTGKEKSKEALAKLFPDVDLTNPHARRSTRTHEGLMDALLIAEYGRRRFENRGV